MLKCIIIDDEQPAVNVLKKYIDRLPNLRLVATETNPVSGIEIVKREKPDIVFLDIQMDEINGIEVMKAVGDCTNVIFCTAYSEFAVTSYELDAVDYLMKPIEFDRFVKAVRRVTDIMAHRPHSAADAIPNDYIFVKAGTRGKMLKIDFDDIDFVEARNNYVAFHRGITKTLVYLSLKELEERLPVSQFMRVHKSYIISLKEISSMENNELVLKKLPRRIPIGANYKEAFMEKMRSKLMS
jgi:DNA-binding LytR/AlgR family response regulator